MYRVTHGVDSTDGDFVRAADIQGLCEEACKRFGRERACENLAERWTRSLGIVTARKTSGTGFGAMKCLG